MHILKELAIEYECTITKAPFDHYFDVYYNYFNCLRDSVNNLLEIGIQTGASLRMWKDFFTNATIHGIDIDDKCLTLQQDRININIGSQDDVEFLIKVADNIGKIDIIIDDGSHNEEHQRISFETLFPYVKSKGYYVIEDLHCAYHNGSLQASQHNQCCSHITNTLIKVVDEVHKTEIVTIKYGTINLQRRISSVNREVESICFYNGICLIRKM